MWLVEYTVFASSEIIVPSRYRYRLYSSLQRTYKCVRRSMDVHRRCPALRRGRGRRQVATVDRPGPPGIVATGRSDARPPIRNPSGHKDGSRARDGIKRQLAVTEREAKQNPLPFPVASSPFFPQNLRSPELTLPSQIERTQQPRMSVAAARSPSPGPAARPCCGLRRSADSSPFRPAASPPGKRFVPISCPFQSYISGRFADSLQILGVICSQILRRGVPPSARTAAAAPRRWKRRTTRGNP